MSNQILKLSENAVQRIKEIMTLNKTKAVGVRIGVKSGGCAGMKILCYGICGRCETERAK